MSSEEFNLIREIFRLKIEKSNYISIQSYEYAAISRDLEREREKELISLFEKNISDITNDDRYSQTIHHKKISEYFENNFNISYPNNLVTKQEQNYYNAFIKRLIRQYKLNKLGI
jgi:hypothetical protein